METALGYLAYRFLFRALDFFHHWYADASRSIFHYFISALERLDRSLAFRATLKHLFEPLYKDYTVIGRIVGFAFRLIRLALGLVVYLVLGGLFLVFYLVWLLLPPAFLASALKSLLK